MSGRDDINTNNLRQQQQRLLLSNSTTNDDAVMIDSSSRDSDDDPSSSQGSSPSTKRVSKEVRTSNISELVSKSKKAASSLWTLLHAKVS
jgi:hypothetical protein